jgi:DNA replication protein DnaC
MSAAASSGRMPLPPEWRRAWPWRWYATGRARHDAPRRGRFTTATALINDLAEAAHANQLSRALGRWERLDLICIDELGYVPLAETACELMFQVIADRAEKAAVIVTTNLPFSEWSQVIPNPRLCKALIDRLTDRAHIITTGADSYRFRRTAAQRKAAKS